MNGLQTLVTSLATWLAGPFGASVIAIAVTATALAAALHFVQPRTVFMSLVFGAIAFSAAYFVTLIGA